jgi:hypothetical protein
MLLFSPKAEVLLRFNLGWPTGFRGDMRFLTLLLLLYDFTLFDL